MLLLESWECGNRLGDSQGVVDGLGLAIRNPGISTALLFGCPKEIEELLPGRLPSSQGTSAHRP